MWGWWAGRFTQCPWQVPIIIGECGLDQRVADGSVAPERAGWQGRMSASAYSAQVSDYVQRCAADPRIAGVCLFTTDCGHPWDSFDTLPAHGVLGAIHIESKRTFPIVEPPEPDASVAEVVHPCPGVPITQHWGQNADAYAQFGLWGHNGTDFGTPNGTPVRSVAAGIVAWVGLDPAYGNYVRIWHDELDCHSFYAHLSGARVAQGTVVEAGQIVGLSGATGNATGPHLHLEIRLGNLVEYATGTPMPKGRIDPETWAIQRGVTL